MIYTNVTGTPLDAPQCQPLFDEAARRDVPIWPHPARARRPDHSSEDSGHAMWTGVLRRGRGAVRERHAFDPTPGLYIRQTIQVIESLDFSVEDERRIYSGNAERLLRLKLESEVQTTRAERS